MTARRYTALADQLRRTAELDALRLRRRLTDQEAAEADRLAHAAYMRAWRAAQTERERAFEGATP
jgi:hypothetical protein